MLKLVAIGNRLMKDDGVAIAITEELRNKLEARGFEVIIAETDFQFCFHLLSANDFVILLDAVSIGGNPGSVHVFNLQEAVFGHHKPGSQHEMSILDLLRLYSKPLKGYLIGIDIAETGFGLELSEALTSQFDAICLEVENVIYRNVKHKISSSGIK